MSEDVYMAAAQHPLATVAERVSAVFGPERASGVRSEAFRDAIPDRDIDELVNRLERQNGPHRGTRVKKGNRLAGICKRQRARLCPPGR